jgi:hypothetical protein
LSARVRLASVLIRVVDASDELGSLNPMWLLALIPSSCTRTGPVAVSSCSYSAAAFTGSGWVPSGPCTRAGSMSTWSVSSSRITWR